MSRIRFDPSDTPEEAAAREWRNRRHDVLTALRAAEAALSQADAAAAGHRLRGIGVNSVSVGVNDVYMSA